MTKASAVSRHGHVRIQQQPSDSSMANSSPSHLAIIRRTAKLRERRRAALDDADGELRRLVREGFARHTRREAGRGGRAVRAEGVPDLAGAAEVGGSRCHEDVTHPKLTAQTRADSSGLTLTKPDESPQARGKSQTSDLGPTNAGRRQQTERIRLRSRRPQVRILPGAPP